MRLLLASAILVILPATALCQAMVESAILSGAAASAASGSAKATSDALSKSLHKLNSALAGAASTGASSTPAIPIPKTASTPPLPKPSQTVFEGVEPGTPRADVIAKAGKPQSAIVSSDDEMLKYATSEGGSVRIRVVDGKVSSIEQTPPKKAPEPPPTPKAETVAASIVSSGK